MSDEGSPLRVALDNLELSQNFVYQRPSQIKRHTDEVVRWAGDVEAAVAAFLDAMDAFLESSARDTQPEPILLALYTCMGREPPAKEAS